MNHKIYCLQTKESHLRVYSVETVVTLNLICFYISLQVDMRKVYEHLEMILILVFIAPQSRKFHQWNISDYKQRLNKQLHKKHLRLFGSDFVGEV